MIVEYRASEDDTPRLCVRVDMLAKGYGWCYHCDMDVDEGTPVSYLVSIGDEAYRLHGRCADETCTAVGESGSDPKHLNIEQLKSISAFRDEHRKVWIRTLPEGEIYHGTILEGNGGILALWGETSRGEWGKETHYGVKWLAYLEKPEEKETYTLVEGEKIVLGETDEDKE